MRRVDKEPKQIPSGATMSISWFALFPVRVKNETRWLERVTVEYEYFPGYLTAMPGWTAKRFL